MASMILRGFRSVAAAVVGYLVVVLGTLLTFEVWLGGISYAGSSNTVLALATAGAFASGFAGGLTAALIGGTRRFLHAAGILVFLTLDTINILVTGISNDPVWFDLGGSGILMGTALLAGYLMERRDRLASASQPGLNYS